MRCKVKRFLQGSGGVVVSATGLPIEPGLTRTVFVAGASRMDCQLLTDAIQRHNHFPMTYQAEREFCTNGSAERKSCLNSKLIQAGRPSFRSPLASSLIRTSVCTDRLGSR